MSWRGIWLRAQLSGITISSVVWLVAAALEPTFVAVAWTLGALLVAAWSSRLALQLRCGGRRVSSTDRQLVSRAVAPVRSLRGRCEPEVRVTRRRRVGIIVGAHSLVINRALLDALRAHRISELHLATLAARAVSVAPVNGSRLVAAVELFCLPWSLLRRLTRAVAGAIPRLSPVTGIASWMAWVVLTLAVIELHQRELWVSLVMVLLAGIGLTTSGRTTRAWARRLEELAEAEAQRSGLRLDRPEEPDPWDFLHEHDADPRPERGVWP
jgi:hypothetical protein